MRLLDFLDAGPQVQALCRSGRRADALIVSPLPNLRMEPGAAVAEIVHHPLLEPANGSGLSGNAAVRLRGKDLHVCVTADRLVHIDLRRRHDCDDLLLVVTACGAARPDCVSSARFDLAMRDRFAALAADDLPISQAEALGPAALQGLSTRGWLAGAPAPPQSIAPSQAPSSDRTYFLRRIKDEIDAAMRAQEPGVASRHVQIATLLARRLRDRPPSDNAPTAPAREALAAYFSCFASEPRRPP
jgi:hypothetical protein